jgi:hypothetical protein
LVDERKEDGMLTASEHKVRMAARLYEMRDTARRLLGSEYAATMGNLGTALQGVAHATGREPLSVAIEAARDAHGLQQCYILAAAVELTEPTRETPNVMVSGLP